MRHWVARKLKKIIQIPLISIQEVIDTHFKTCPNFLTLDVEGYDYQILQSIDFEKYRPEALCVETITYSENNTGHKIQEIVELMQTNDFIYADTYVNKIFVDRTAWKNT